MFTVSTYLNMYVHILFIRYIKWFLNHIIYIVFRMFELEYSVYLYQYKYRKVNNFNLILLAKQLN